jgi:hypothetical protein
MRLILILNALAVLIDLATAKVPRAKPAATTTTASSMPAASLTPAIPAASSVVIKSVSTSGSGCPAGSVSISISDERSVVTLGFDDFDTYIGPGTQTSDHSKACDVHLSLRFPKGYTFGVLDATYHGYAQLDPGVTGNLSSTYQLVDGSSFAALADSAATATSATLTGTSGNFRSGGEFTQDNSIAASKVTRSPCNRNVDLIVHTMVSLSSTNASASGSLTDDDATFKFTQQVNLGWAKCSS